MTALTDLLPTYLGRQRWFAGGAPTDVTVVEEQDVAERLVWMVVDADGSWYQVLVGFAPGDAPPDFLHGHEGQIVGAVDGRLAFDAALDPELGLALLHLVAPEEHASHVRPVGAEQSNTSLVFDDQTVLKFFRRLQVGANPEVEITTALAGAGFDHVAEPVGTWRRNDLDVDLAIAQRFLAGGTEGWALALTSLRDLYATGCPDPAECGGDFAAEASRLGTVTAQLHLAMAKAFGVEPGDAAGWADGMRRQLDAVAAGEPWYDRAGAALERLAQQPDPGRATRVHGDYHLGQVMRTDGGWFVLDFEGEPARPIPERRRPSSPLKDVAGMARSFHYASEVALLERSEVERDEIASLARAWEERNREAFLAAYFETPDITTLLPTQPSALAAVLGAWELDKAVYELAYERAYRPQWEAVPITAIERLLAGEEGPR